MTPRPTSERVWIAYLVCLLLVGWTAPGGGSPGHDVAASTCLHGGMLVVALGVMLLARRSHDKARMPRAVMAMIGLPVVFSGLCWLLPGVHPEPYEYRWLAIDRWLFGTDIARFADLHLMPWCVEILQLVYASFYAIVILSAFGAGAGSGKAAFDRATLQLVCGFLCSYLGYLLVPTLAPKLVLAHAAAPQGLWLTPILQRCIDQGELNPWDCFPSGHTMLTIISLTSLWRWNRRWFRWLLVPGLVLIVSTVLLRYHWSIDVVVGALLAWPCVRLCDLLADRDGWPRAATRAATGHVADATPA